MRDPSVQDMYAGHAVLNRIDTVLKLREHTAADVSFLHQLLRLVDRAQRILACTDGVNDGL